MSIVDYGAIVKKDGVFINKNFDLFADCSDTGYVCEEAIDKNGNKKRVNGNYYVYAGDEKCLLAFYKGRWTMISNNEIVLENSYGTQFESETFFPVKDGLPTITISHLDRTLYEDRYLFFLETPWENYVIHTWNDEKTGLPCTGNEKLTELRDGYKHRKWYLKMLKRIARTDRNHEWPKYRTYRFVAEWEWKDHKYEVIFGYGIDPNEEVWNEIKEKNESDDFSYGFTRKEKEIINTWFYEVENMFIEEGENVDIVINFNSDEIRFIEDKMDTEIEDEVDLMYTVKCMLGLEN